MPRLFPAGAFMIIAVTAFAQSAETPILTIEQAQQRARYAREQMTAAERKVRAAEKKEHTAHKDLEAAQKRMEDAQRAYAEAKVRAEQASQALPARLTELNQPKARHQQEHHTLTRAYHAAPAEH